MRCAERNAYVRAFAVGARVGYVEAHGLARSDADVLEDTAVALAVSSDLDALKDMEAALDSVALGPIARRGFEDGRRIAGKIETEDLRRASCRRRKVSTE